VRARQGFFLVAPTNLAAWFPKPPSPTPVAPRVNCPFFFKMGACRHGDRCSRAHNQPVFSQTICLVHLYQNPMNEVETAKKLGIPPPDIDERQMEEDFLNFYEEVHEELSKFGEIEEMNVCDNLGDHMIGACLGLTRFWIAGRDAGHGWRVADLLIPPLHFPSTCRQCVRQVLHRGGRDDGQGELERPVLRWPPHLCGVLPRD
jgi:hypothetical protein